MIDLKFEHDKVISTQNFYNIISNAIDVAEDDGMLNSFIFERALYVFAAATIYEDITEKVMEKISNFPELWDELIEDGIIDKLVEDYPSMLNQLEKIARQWFEEYDAHIHSSYAVVTAISNIVSNFTSNFQKEVNEFQSNEDLSKVIKTAAKWGMDNGDIHQAAQDESTLKLISKDKIE